MTTTVMGSISAPSMASLRFGSPFSGDQAKWPAWKATFSAVMLCLGYSSVLEAPPASDDMANHYVYTALMLNTEGIAQDTVIGVQNSDGHTAWRELLTLCEPSSIARTTALQSQLFTSRLQEDQNPDIFFLSIERLRRELSGLGTSYSDSSLISIVIAGLPTQYKPVIAVLNSSTTLAYSHVKDQVRAYYLQFIQPLQQLTMPMSSQAMSAVAPDTSSKCTHCTLRGHSWAVCKFRLRGDDPGKPSHRQGPVICHRCGGQGHIERHCHGSSAAAHTTTLSSAPPYLVNYAS